MNYWLIIEPVGVILIGLASIIYWTKKKHQSKKLFLAGALIWLIASFIEIFIETIALSPLLTFLSNSLGTVLFIILASIIIGFKSGFFMPGVTYLYIKNRLKKLKLIDAVAIGIGIGAVESILTGILNLVTYLTLSSPALIAELTTEEQSAIQALLNHNVLSAIVVWAERISIQIVYVFATLLVVKSVLNKDKKFLWKSMLYKSLIDVSMPMFQLLISQYGLVLAILSEIYIVAIGIIGLYFVLREFSTKRELENHRTGTTKKI